MLHTENTTNSTKNSYICVFDSKPSNESVDDSDEENNDEISVVKIVSSGLRFWIFNKKKILESNLINIRKPICTWIFNIYSSNDHEKNTNNCLKELKIIYIVK